MIGRTLYPGWAVALLLYLSGIPLQLSLAYQEKGTSSTPAPPPLTITTESLPTAPLRRFYRERLRASGGAGLLRWTVTNGELPPGLDLDENGMLSGTPTRMGEYRFVVTVTDSSRPAHSISRKFTMHVIAPLVLEWSMPPRVEGNLISGSVKVSNGTADDFDLTLIVVAVNEIGKAFAIGYQRFDLKSGTSDFEIPFGSTVPLGAYVVHVDAVAEVEPKNTIYRRRLQTPSALQVTQPL